MVPSLIQMKQLLLKLSQSRWSECRGQNQLAFESIRFLYSVSRKQPSRTSRVFPGTIDYYHKKRLTESEKNIKSTLIACHSIFRELGIE